MNENSERHKIVFQIHPCTEDGLVTIEAKLYLGSPFGRPGEDFFETRQMCASLKRLRFLDSLRCSEDMGYALAEWEGKRIHVFKGGKIVIRRAKDDDDAKKTLDMIGRVLWASIPCSCGKPLVHCASGECDECSDKVCKTQAYPPFVEVPKISGEIKGGEVFEHVRELETKDLYLHAFSKLGNFMSTLKEMDAKLVNKDFANLDALVKRGESFMSEACESGTRFIIETPNDISAALGMIFLGMAEDLGDLMDAMLMTKDVGYTTEEYEEARDIAFGAYDSFMNNGDNMLAGVIGRYRELMGTKHPKPIIEIARAGFHIVRMQSKPFPV